MQIGYIGLGKMGLNMVLRLLEKGHEVIAFDPNEEARKKAEEAGAKTFDSLFSVIDALDDQKMIWLMVPHQAVDDVVSEILPLCKEGDIIIDGGNSHYKKTVERAERAKEKLVQYIDAGVSGGPEGARTGACIMVGGDKDAITSLDKIFHDIAAPDAYRHVGQSGAGHFVKMVHNGIEYGMMQAIAEGFEVMKKSEYNLNLTEIADLYNHKSVNESRLIGWLKDAYEEYGEDLDAISGKVSHSGEGLWTVEAAEEMGISTPIIKGSLDFRIQSQGNPSYTGQVVSALRNQFGGHEVKKKNNETK